MWLEILEHSNCFIKLFAFSKKLNHLIIKGAGHISDILTGKIHAVFEEARFSFKKKVSGSDGLGNILCVNQYAALPAESVNKVLQKHVKRDHFSSQVCEK